MQVDTGMQCASGYRNEKYVRLQPDLCIDMQTSISRISGDLQGFRTSVNDPDDHQSQSVFLISPRHNHLHVEIEIQNRYKAIHCNLKL